MIRSILIGLDGSRESDPALDYGVRLAQRFDATIVGCAVVDEPGVRVSEATLFAEGHYGPSDPDVLKAARQRAERTLAHFKDTCQKHSVRGETRLDLGTPHLQIVAEAHRYDLVLLGCHAHFELGWRTAEDATLNHVLQECARPTIVVPSGPAPALDGPAVIAFDGSIRASRALFDFVGSRLAHDREVHVVSVDRDHSVAARIAGRAIDFLRFHDIQGTPHAFDGAFPAADAFLGAVDRLGATIAVIGAYGHARLRELLLGSTTRTVIAHAPVPVFCSR
jgi:nucleotide-binding universal stress UspA family protein